MASLIPYSNYEHALRRQFPFDMLDDLLASPLTVNSNDAFKMNVEDTGDAYVVTAHLAGVNRDEIDVELNEGECRRLYTAASRALHAVALLAGEGVVKALAEVPAEG